MSAIKCVNHTEAIKGGGHAYVLKGWSQSIGFPPVDIKDLPAFLTSLSSLDIVAPSRKERGKEKLSVITQWYRYRVNRLQGRPFFLIFEATSWSFELHYIGQSLRSRGRRIQPLGVYDYLKFKNFWALLVERQSTSDTRKINLKVDTYLSLWPS